MAGKIRFFLLVICLLGFSQTATTQCDCDNTLVRNKEQFEIFLSTYADCETIKGTLRLYGEDQYDISRLTKLRYIDKIDFSGCKQLKSITLPPQLNSCGHLKISRCKLLEEIDLAKLTEAGQIELSYLHQLKRLRNTQYLNKLLSLQISYAGSEFEIEHAFKQLTEVSYLTFEGNPNKEIWTLPNHLFPELKKVINIGFNGFNSLYIRTTKKTKEVQIFPLLESVDGLQIQKIKNLYLLNGKNESLANIRFPKLQSASMVYLTENGDWLKDLNGFSTQMETNSAFIQNNPALSFCGSYTFLCSFLNKIEDPNTAKTSLAYFMTGNRNDSCIISGELYDFCNEQKQKQQKQQLADVLEGKEPDQSLANGLRTVPQIGHVTKIIETALSPDGKLLATLSLDGWLKVWNIASRKLIISICNPCYQIDSKKDHCGDLEEIKDKQIYQSYLEHLSSPAFSKDSKKISVKGNKQKGSSPN